MKKIILFITFITTTVFGIAHASQISLSRSIGDSVRSTKQLSVNISATTAQAAMLRLKSDGIRSFAKLGTSQIDALVATEAYYKAAPDVYSKLRWDLSKSCKVSASGENYIISCPSDLAKTWMSLVYMHTLTIAKYSIDPIERKYASGAISGVISALASAGAGNLDFPAFNYGAYNKDLIFIPWFVTASWSDANKKTVAFTLSPDKGKHPELYQKRMVEVSSYSPYEFTIRESGWHCETAYTPTSVIQPISGCYYQIPLHSHPTPRKYSIWNCDEGYYRNPNPNYHDPRSPVTDAWNACLPDDTPVPPKKVRTNIPGSTNSSRVNITNLPDGSLTTTPQTPIGEMRYGELGCITLECSAEAAGRRMKEGQELLDSLNNKYKSGSKP